MPYNRTTTKSTARTFYFKPIWGRKPYCLYSDTFKLLKQPLVFSTFKLSVQLAHTAAYIYNVAIQAVLSFGCAIVNIKSSHIKNSKRHRGFT